MVRWFSLALAAGALAAYAEAGGALELTEYEGEIHGFGHGEHPGARRFQADLVAHLAAAVRDATPATTPVIVLCDDAEIRLPEGVYPLSVPLRPAKLRALLDQLQKTLAKSIP
mgnify:CR=1 FL=1